MGWGTFSDFPKLAEIAILCMIGINSCFIAFYELDAPALHWFPEN